MDWMNQNANAGGYDPNTAPVNLSPFANRAVGVMGDVVGQGFNQMAAFGAGALGVNHAFSNTPVYDKLVREPAGENPATITPNMAQKIGAATSDVAMLPFRGLKALGNYIDPREVNPVASFHPAFDVINQLQDKAAAAPATTAAPAAPVGGIDFSKFQTLKTKAVPLEQALPQPKAAAPVAATPQNIPNGALMEMAKIANTRKIIGARDHILGAVYGWHQASYMDAYKKLQANPNDKDAQAQMQKAREGATSLVSGTALGQQAMFGAQQQDVQ